MQNYLKGILLSALAGLVLWAFPANAATIIQPLECNPTSGPSDISFVMHVGDNVNFIPADGNCVLYSVPPTGFFPNTFSGGWSFKAVLPNVSFPYYYIIFTGSSGRIVTYSIVVYSP
jgi:hypothetical protein